MTSAALLLIAFGCLWQSLTALVVLEHLECRYDGQLCGNNTCYSQLSRARVPLMTWGCYYPQPVAAPRGRLAFYRQLGDQLSPPLIDLEENLCDLFSKRSRNTPIMRFSEYFGIKRFRCPLKGNATVHRMPLNLSALMHLFTGAKYFGSFTMRSKNQTFLDVRVNFTFTKK